MYTAEQILLAGIEANLTTHQLNVLFKKMIEAKKPEPQPALQQTPCSTLREEFAQLLNSVQKLKEGSDIGGLVHVTMQALEYKLQEGIELMDENMPVA